MESDLIYADERVSVSPALAVIDGVSYPVAGLTSLAVRREPQGRGCLAAAVLAAAVACLGFALLGGLATAYDRGARGPWGLVTFLAVIGLGLGRLWLRLRNPPQMWALVVTTAAGERRALVSPDAARLDRVRAALEEAVLRRA